MACAFVGLKVVGGAKPVALPDVADLEVKITNAALEGKGKAELFVHRGEDEKYLVCVLDESKGVYQAHLEYAFSPEDPVPVTFSVSGKGTTVHITGFAFEQPGEDFSYDEDDESMFGEGSDDDEDDEDEDDSESEEEGSVIGIREITSDEEKAAAKSQKKAIPQKADNSKPKPKQQEAAVEEGDFKCAPCQKAFPNVRALDQHNIQKHSKPQSKSEAKLAPAKPAEVKTEAKPAPAKPAEAKPEGNGKKSSDKQEKTPDTPKKPEQKKPQPQTPQPAKVQQKSTPAPKAEEKKPEEKKFDDKKRKASASQGQLAKKPKSN
jgi:hypothetical protein